jgi:hypothetical protein
VSDPFTSVRVSPAPDHPHEIDFTVCTLVRHETNYARLLDSFSAHGFTAENSEFLMLDNVSENRFDGYDGLRAAALQARGRYILFTHDDIELKEDGHGHLKKILADLSAIDPRWMVAGNSGNEHGVDWKRSKLRYISDPHGQHREISSPRRVISLDENFLILRRDLMVFPSVDLNGFHLFATDLCLQAELAGGRAYIVPFMLHHHSGGKIDPAFDSCRTAFREKYATLLKGRILRTPSTVIPLGTAASARFRVFRWIRRVRRKLGLGDPMN